MGRLEAPLPAPVACDTIGIDLSAQPRSTSMTVLRWGDRTAQVVDVRVGLSDEDLLKVFGSLGAKAKVGIDAPFGWPDPFVDFVTAHRAGELGADYAAPQPGDWRNSLRNRATDLDIRQRLKVVPLSVSADKIASLAMRCASLLAAVQGTLDVRRDGAGDVVEVYPAATLHSWCLVHRGYKGTDHLDQRRRLLKGLTDRMPWLELGDFGTQLAASDDAFDSLVCALTARAAACGASAAPPAELRERALREGWIHVPVGSPKDLIANVG